MRRAELALAKDDASLHLALRNIADQYYDFFRREPVMRDLWHATQADRLLREIDAEGYGISCQGFSQLESIRPITRA